MGLDIYFYSRKMELENVEELHKAEERIEEIYSIEDAGQFQAHRAELEELRLKVKEMYSRTQVAYFRKVNFLMPFFNYEGNCEYVEIERTKVEELVDTCKEILDLNKKSGEDFTEYCIGKWKKDAKAKLPTTSGFFFGSTEYDEYYLLDVQEVYDTFKNVLDTFDWDNNVLEMYCWW